VIDYEPWIVSNSGIELDPLLLSNEAWFREELIDNNGIGKRHDFAIAILPFRVPNNVVEYIGSLLAGNSPKRKYSRIATPNGTASLRIPGRIAAKAISKVIILSPEQVFREIRGPCSRTRTVYFESAEFQVQDIILSRCNWNPDDRSPLSQPDVTEHFQEALLKIISNSNKGFNDTFHLLVSNSSVRQDAMPSPHLGSKIWHFRTLGIAIIPDDIAFRLFDDRRDIIFPERIIKVESQNVIIQQAYSSVDVTLNESDTSHEYLIYSLNVTRCGDNK
jgi:hypothetical protein